MKKPAAILMLLFALGVAGGSVATGIRTTCGAWPHVAARYPGLGFARSDPDAFASESTAKAAAARAAAGPAPVGYITDLPSPDAELVAFSLQYDAAPLLFDLNPRLPARLAGAAHRFEIVGLAMDRTHPTPRAAVLEVSTNAAPAIAEGAVSGYRIVWSDSISGGLFLRLYRKETP